MGVASRVFREIHPVLHPKVPLHSSTENVAGWVGVREMRTRDISLDLSERSWRLGKVDNQGDKSRVGNEEEESQLQ